MVWTGSLELNVESVDPLFKKLGLLQAMENQGKVFGADACLSWRFVALIELPHVKFHRHEMIKQQRQLWTTKTVRALPPWSGWVCAMLNLPALHHEHQLEFGECCAYHLRDVLFNLDMLAVARTFKICEPTRREEGAPAEDEEVPDNERGVRGEGEGEFFGEGCDELDVEDDSADFDKDSIVEHSFDEEQVAAILGRDHEIDLANKKGRNKEVHTQMNEFDKLFHNALTNTVPRSNGAGLRHMFFYNDTATANNAMDFQESVLRNMRTQKENPHEMAETGNL